EALPAPGHVAARLTCQLFNGFREVEPIEFLHELDDAAMGATAKAVIMLVARVRVDIHGRGFFIVKRAAGGVVGTRFLEADARAQDIDDIEPGTEVVNELLGDQAGHVIPSIALPGQWLNQQLGRWLPYCLDRA